MIVYSAINLILCILISVNSAKSQCVYFITKSDNSSEKCFSNQCSQFIDLYSMSLEDKYCKTSLVNLSFSSYKTFVSFRDRLQWKLTDLFPNNSNNESRQLILILSKIEIDDKPFSHDQLVKLGFNIDFYILYVGYLSDKYYLYKSIDFQRNISQYNILKLKIQCISLTGFDMFPCSSKILSPKRISLFNSTTLHLNENELLLDSNRSIGISSSSNVHLITFLLITTILILIVFLFLIYKYFRLQSQSMSKTSQSSQNRSSQNFLSSNSDQIHVSAVQLDRSSTNDASMSIENQRDNNNYETFSMDKNSCNWQFCFVPISSNR